MEYQGGGVVPVDASDENDEKGAGDGVAELLKLGVVPQLPAVGALGLGQAHVLAHADIVVGAEDAKDDEHDDLQGHAGDDGAVAALLQLGVGLAAGRGDAAANGLDDEAAQVGGQEDEGVPARADARHGRVEVDGDVLERQVDGDADEGGREDDGADLQLKRAVVPRVGVQLDAANVACEV